MSLIKVDQAKLANGIKEQMRGAVQEHIDATAQSRGYENGFTLAGYTSSTVPEWQAEAHAFVGWRDGVWLFVYDLLDQIKNGQAQPPETVEALINSLPEIQWQDEE